MRRTELLQEIRKMRFEEAFGGWQEGRLLQEEAARLLGVCDRSFRRYVERYEEGGLEGLIDKRGDRFRPAARRSMRCCASPRVIAGAISAGT